MSALPIEKDDRWPTGLGGNFFGGGVSVLILLGTFTTVSS